MITVFSEHIDNVINGIYLNAVTNYSFGIERLFPLVGKLDIQRKLQTPRFYQRLERDLLNGCIMPNLTLAFVVDRTTLNGVSLTDFVNNEIDNAFVLDGIQRLNTLERTAKDISLDLSRPLFLNIIICHSIDNLLYRMITLNNGQKPMSARHQIEILAANLLDFSNLPITVQSEKETAKGRASQAFHKADIIKAYIAFLSGLDNIENQKIIEQKMDELIAERVLDSNITVDHLEFSNVLNLIRSFTNNEYLSAWIKLSNNLIGFAVGIKQSFTDISGTLTTDFEESVRTFEEAFTSIDVSQIKLGVARRKLVHHFIANYSQFSSLTSNDMLLEIADLI